MAVTLHTCNGGNGYWDNCDRGGNFFLNTFLFINTFYFFDFWSYILGCQTNAFFANSNLMCPEDRCAINTNKPFTVSHYQTASQGTLLLLHIQNGRNFGLIFFSTYKLNSIWLPIYQEFEIINCKRLMWLQTPQVFKKNEFWLFTTSINKFLFIRY